jgi:hypothetical protein
MIPNVLRHSTLERLRLKKRYYQLSLSVDRASQGCHQMLVRLTATEQDQRRISPKSEIPSESVPCHKGKMKEIVIVVACAHQTTTAFADSNARFNFAQVSPALPTDKSLCEAPNDERLKICRRSGEPRDVAPSQILPKRTANNSIGSASIVLCYRYT